MGYILPIVPYQSMQYANRIDFRNEKIRYTNGTLPVFALALNARMQEHTALTETNHLSLRPDITREYRKNEFQQIKQVNLSDITGKGYIIDCYA